jgi:glucose-6-phosphate isomerase/transaldolase/glucose-6-phosphate isomerase
LSSPRHAGPSTAKRGAGSFTAALTAALTELDAEEVPRRIRGRDHTVWREDPTEIADRLGWLDAPGWMRSRLARVRNFCDDLAAEGVRDVVLLGMGGSSLAPEVLRATFGSAPGHPRLHVLDSTSPRRIRAVTAALEPERLHVLVSSKSGSTIEVRTLLAHFREVAGGGEGARRRFSAITDPGTELARAAQADGFRERFENDPDIGGRFSALSFFGMVPAAILGIDAEEMLRRAERLRE